MKENYYAPGEERAAKVQRLFASIASRYDLLNDLQSFGLHRYWKNQLVKITGPQPNETILDLCSGTGDIAFLFSEKGSRVVGADFTLPMLNVAYQRDTSESIAWIQADALALPFRDESVDIVTVGYGLRNLRQFRDGLAEMLRVLRPGGRLAILEFGKPDNRFWRTVYFSYLRMCVPVFGKLFAGNTAAYAYILESLHHYPGQHGINEMLAGLPTRNRSIRSFLGGVMTINYAEKI